MIIAGNKVAVDVTGANRGIGQALVQETLRRGARQAYGGTRRTASDPDPRVTPVALDVTDAAQIRAAGQRVESLDVLINNAGVALHDDLTDPPVLEEHLRVNLFGPSQSIALSWGSSGAAKLLERRYAALMQPQPAT